MKIHIELDNRDIAWLNKEMKKKKTRVMLMAVFEQAVRQHQEEQYKKAHRRAKRQNPSGMASTAN